MNERDPHRCERLQIEHNLTVKFVGADVQTHLLTQILKLLEKIMSAISDFAAKQDAFNDQIDAAVSGLTGDIAALNAEIAKLQSTPGIITPEDQALLDRIQARSRGIADKLTALDALTPPALPDGGTGAPGSPAAPVGVTSTAATGNVTFAWATPQADATSFNIYTSTTTGVTPANGTKTADVTSPNVQSVTTGTTLFAVVTAVNANGESVPSAEVAATAT